MFIYGHSQPLLCLRQHNNPLVFETSLIKICIYIIRRYGVNMSHPASQIWLDSVYGQYADWGVDLIKNDCIFAGNMIEDNIKGEHFF